jgi:hypothetical protein
MNWDNQWEAKKHSTATMTVTAFVVLEVKLWFVAARIPISAMEMTCKDTLMAFSALNASLQLLQ